MIDRRALLLGGLALGAGCAGHPHEARRARADFRGLQAMLGPGGRLGVAALDTGTGRWLLHDENGRYAMASTFKLPLAAAILAEVEAGRLALDQEIAFTRADLVPYAPVVEANLERGRLPVERLCAAIVEVSDNAAANLLLARIGGPAGLTRFCRAHGDARDPARPHRARAQRQSARRPARHHQPGRDGRPDAHICCSATRFAPAPARG